MCGRYQQKKICQPSTQNLTQIKKIEKYLTAKPPNVETTQSQFEKNHR